MEQFINNGLDQLAASITSTATSLTLTLGNVPTTTPFRLIIDGEIIGVGTRTGLVCSALTRGMESTIATGHNAGTTVVCGLTVGSMIQAILDRV